MNCKYIEDDLILYYYDELDSSSKRELEKHLKDCNKCVSSLERLKAGLKDTEIHEPEMAESFWNNYRAAVRKKIEGRSLQKNTVLFRPGFFRFVSCTLLLLFIVFGGLRLYELRQESKFIMDNYELIVDLELFENFELLEHLEEIEDI